MHKLLIVSRDADAYRERIDAHKIASLDIVQAVSDIRDLAPQDRVDILLGDPDMCAQALHRIPEIDWIQSTWAGVKPIVDTQKVSTLLTGIKGVFGEQMREYVMAYLLHFNRQIDEFQQLQQRQEWLQPRCAPLSGQTIGILGLGSIGLEVAHTAKHFGMKVIGVSRKSIENLSIDKHYTLDQHADFAPQLDYLVCLLPHTTATEKVINDAFLSKLKPSCVIINAGRPQSIDYFALQNALENNRLRAAVLDVFEQEPLPQSSPLWRMSNVLITQHTAAISNVDDITGVFMQNYLHFCENKPLNFQIDWDIGY